MQNNRFVAHEFTPLMTKMQINLLHNIYYFEFLRQETAFFTVFNSKKASQYIKKRRNFTSSVSNYFKVATMRMAESLTSTSRRSNAAERA